MNTPFWTSGWSWILWSGLFIVFFSSLGNWGYTYQAHRRYRSESPRKSALDVLNERYARGEIKRDDYLRIKDDIAPDTRDSLRSVG